MIIENGKCAACGKPLAGKRLILCQECQEKQTRYERTMLAGAIMNLDRRYWNGCGGDVK